MEVEHTAGASTTTGNPPEGTNDDQTHSGRQTTTHNTTVADQKAAVIGRSKCTLARKMEQGTTLAWDIGARERGANAAPHPDVPLWTDDELSPPLLDGGQGKMSPTIGVDGGNSEMEDGLQTATTSKGDWTDEIGWMHNKVTTAIRDRIWASDASRHPNRVDLPRSETTPKPHNVVPPSGEETTSLHADMTVNGVKPPHECTSTWTRKGVRWQDPVHWNTNEAHTLPGQGRATIVDGIQPPILLSTGHLATGAEIDKSGCKTNGDVTHSRTCKFRKRPNPNPAQQKWESHGPRTKCGKPSNAAHINHPFLLRRSHTLRRRVQKRFERAKRS
jgi:hypothetical protein